ncbi:MAG TPA: hypothetical protein VI318_07065 [Baekduia sp.]
MSAAQRSRARLVALLIATLALAGVAAGALLGHGASGSAPPRATAGLQGGPAPWRPELRFLPSRVAALGLPGQSDTIFHIHALLRIYVDGRPVPVPAGIGIDPLTGFIAPLHTHDATGIIHLEADRPYPFTLGQVFTVWGVRFGAGRLGGYADRGRRRLRVHVEGRRVADPARYVLRAHDHVVVSFGLPGSTPTTDRTPFPPGL